MSEYLLPRERAIKYGISSLENYELLSLIIRSSCKDKSVFQTADEVIELANGFHNLPCLTYEELISIKGINKAKALEILSIFEIAKRLSKLERIADLELLKPQKVYEWLKFSIGFSNQEEFVAIYLSGNGSIIKSVAMYKGTRNKANVSISEILRQALLLKASYIIVAHNHPSNSLQPSKEDIELTNNLYNSCKMMDIPLLDHIIVGKTGYFSFENNNMLK